MAMTGAVLGLLVTTKLTALPLVIVLVPLACLVAGCWLPNTGAVSSPDVDNLTPISALHHRNETATIHSFSPDTPATTSVGGPGFFSNTVQFDPVSDNNTTSLVGP